MTRDARKLYWILLIGLIAIGGTWAARTQLLANRQRAAALSIDPREMALRTQEQSLLTKTAKEPKNISLRWQLADTYQKLGEFDSAAVQLEAIARIKPGDQDTILALGNTYLALKQFPKAEQSYRRGAAQWPRVAAGWQGLAAVLYQQGRYKDAVDAAKHAVQLAPADPNNHYVLAASALEYAKEYPDPQLHKPELILAQLEFEKLVKVWPTNGDLYFRLARIQTGLGHRAEAVTLLQRAVQLAPTEPIYSSLVTALIAIGDRPTALKVAREGVVHYSDSPKLHDLLGQVVQTSGEPGSNEKSLQEAQKAVALSPHNELYQEHLGTAYLRLSDMQNARKAFETAVVLDPNRVFPFQQLSGIYTRLGDAARATTAATAARNGLYNADLLVQVQNSLIDHPENVALHLAVAARYRDLGRSGAAREEYEAALRLDPKNEHARAGLASIVSNPLGPGSQSVGVPSPDVPVH